VTPGLQRVAHLLFGLALLFAIPALAYLVPLIFRRLTGTRAKGNPILRMLGDMLQGSEGMRSFGKMIRHLLIAISLTALALSVLLCITARGLEHGQMWARVIAGLLFGTMFITASIGLFTGKGPRIVRRVVAGIAMISCFSALRALWIG
jgi:hypothetical protein